MSKLNLGYMPPSQLMSMYQGYRELSANREEAQKSLAMYKHPSSGRNQSFLDSAQQHANYANNADARIAVARSSIAPAEQLHRRSDIFTESVMAHRAPNN